MTCPEWKRLNNCVLILLIDKMNASGRLNFKTQNEKPAVPRLLHDDDRVQAGEDELEPLIPHGRQHVDRRPVRVAAVLEKEIIVPAKCAEVRVARRELATEMITQLKEAIISQCHGHPPRPDMENASSHVEHSP